MIDLTRTYTDRQCLVFGATGFIGKAVSQKLLSLGAKVTMINSHNHNLLEKGYDGFSFNFRKRPDPEYVFFCAGKYTGSFRTKDNPALGYAENVQMLLNGVFYPVKNRVFQSDAKIVMLSSVCAYPEQHEWSAREADLFDGDPHPSHKFYGLAKRQTITLAESLREQFATLGSVVLLGNTYGQGDNFDTYSSHVIPALIRRVHTLAQESKASWSFTGSPGTSRDFVYIDDAAEGILRIGASVTDMTPVNLGSGSNTTLEEIVTRLSHIFNWNGTALWKPELPNERVIRIARLLEITGWKPKVTFGDGLQKTVDYYLKHIASR